MVIFDRNGDVVESPDLELGRIETVEEPVTHRYVVDAEEAGHYETVAEYPETGGADVEWRVDSPERGHWETVDEDGEPVEHYDGAIPGDWPHDQEIADIWTYGVYTEYTPEELEEMERRRAEAEFSARQMSQLVAVARMQVASMDLSSESDDAVASVNTMLPDFVPEGHSYKIGDSFLYNIRTYRVATAHTSQAQWKPGDKETESMYYEIVIAPDGILVWRQPTGAHDAPGLGAERHYPDADGPVYVSKRDGNTSVPGADEWWEAVGR